jgi:hypothetical protein
MEYELHKALLDNRDSKIAELEAELAKVFKAMCHSCVCNDPDDRRYCMHEEAKLLHITKQTCPVLNKTPDKKGE